MDVRTEVVALLTDVMPLGPLDSWTRQDGRPLTQDERDLVGSATYAEVSAAREFVARESELARERAEDLQRAHDLIRPYFDRHPDLPTTGEVLPLMTEEDRTEFLQVMERVAPDGLVEMGGDS